MKRMIIAAAAVCMAYIAGAVAYVEWDGTGSWPTSGNVQLSASAKVVVDDAHVAAVEGWDNLYLLPNSRLTFVNATVAATLSAAVEGSGVLAAMNSVGLTLAGDNSVKTGTWVFTNSAVMVTHEYGLGGPASAAAQVYFTASGTLGTLEFRNPAWDEPGWTGKKAFTNHCAISFDCDASYTAVAGKKMYVGSSAADEYFVQDADFITVPKGANKYLRFRNNYEQTSGVFGVSDYNHGQNLMSYADAGAVIRFSGTTKIRCCEKSRGSNGWQASGQYAEYHFGNSGGYHGSKFHVEKGKVTFEADDVFADIAESTLESQFMRLQANFQDNTATTNRWDLNGHDITVSALRSGATPDYDNTQSKYVVFASATPATLTIGGTLPKTETSAIGAKFEGAVSLTVDNKGTNILYCCAQGGAQPNQRCWTTTTGTLTIKNGSTVNLDKYQAWTGRIVVESGGTLILNQNPAFVEPNYPEVEIREGGRIVQNVGLSARKLYVNGRKIPQCGSSNLGTIRRLFGISTDTMEGEDSKVVYVSYKLPFGGWPAEGESGVAVEIPSGSNIVITAADAAAVARVGEIGLGYTSSLTIANTTGTVELNAALSSFSPNYGTIRIVDSAGVVLGGDNYNILQSNAIQIVDSEVLVTHPRALGGPDSGPAQITYGTSLRQVRFRYPSVWDVEGFDGVKVFTNESAVAVTSPGYDSAPIVFGSEAADEYLVQKGAYIDACAAGSSTYDTRTRFKGNVEFIGPVMKANNDAINMQNADDTVVKFGPSCVFSGKNANGDLGLTVYSPNHPNAGKVVFAMDDGTSIRRVTGNKGWIKAGADDPFGGVSSAIVEYSYIQTTWDERKVVLDLDGHSTTVATLTPSYYNSASLLISGSGIVTSAAPAALTVAGAGSFPTNLLEFVGAAGFRYCGGRTNILVNCASTSTGDFRVSSGVAGFDLGATWAGSVTVDAGATLYVGAKSAPAFGGNALGDRTATILNIAETGALRLESGTNYVLQCIRGGSNLQRGVYTAANSGWISGAGAIKVLSNGTAPSGLLIIAH